MADLGILLTDELALAAFEGRKTETRRPVDAAGYRWVGFGPCSEDPGPAHPARHCERHDGVLHAHLNEFNWCNFHRANIRGAGAAEPGGRLWVRECWRDFGLTGAGEPWRIEYRAGGHLDLPRSPNPLHTGAAMGRWRPSIHMPKWASRTWGRIESVRAERLDAITEAGAVREGFAADEHLGTTARQNFLAAWCRLYGEFAGDFALINNPFVWVISWTPISKPELSNG